MPIQIYMACKSRGGIICKTGFTKNKEKKENKINTLV